LAVRRSSHPRRASSLLPPPPSLTIEYSCYDPVLVAVWERLGGAQLGGARSRSSFVRVTAAPSGQITLTDSVLPPENHIRNAARRAACSSRCRGRHQPPGELCGGARALSPHRGRVLCCVARDQDPGGSPRDLSQVRRRRSSTASTGWRTSSTGRGIDDPEAIGARDQLRQANRCTAMRIRHAGARPGRRRPPRPASTGCRRRREAERRASTLDRPASALDCAHFLECCGPCRQGTNGATASSLFPHFFGAIANWDGRRCA
jgi:hypothetical protein